MEEIQKLHKDIEIEKNERTAIETARGNAKEEKCQQCSCQENDNRTEDREKVSEQIQEEIGKKEQEIEELNKNKEELTNQVNKKEQEVEQTKAEYGKKSEDCKKKGQEITTLKKQIVAYEERLENALGSISQREKECMHLTEDLDNIKRVNKDLTLEMTEQINKSRKKEVQNGDTEAERNGEYNNEREEREKRVEQNKEERPEQENNNENKKEESSKENTKERIIKMKVCRYRDKCNLNFCRFSHPKDGITHTKEKEDERKEKENKMEEKRKETQITREERRTSDTVDSKQEGNTNRKEHRKIIPCKYKEKCKYGVKCEFYHTDQEKIKMREEIEKDQQGRIERSESNDAGESEKIKNSEVDKKKEWYTERKNNRKMIPCRYKDKFRYGLKCNFYHSDQEQREMREEISKEKKVRIERSEKKVKKKKPQICKYLKINQIERNIKYVNIQKYMK